MFKKFKKKHSNRPTNEQNKIVVNPRTEAEWIREHCTKKFSIEDIMEILDYEMGYLASLGLVNISEKELKENLEYWAEHNN